MPALACKWFLDTENKWFHDAPYHTDDPTISWTLDEPELRKAEPVRPSGVCEAGLSGVAEGPGRLMPSQCVRLARAKLMSSGMLLGRLSFLPYGP